MNALQRTSLFAAAVTVTAATLASPLFERQARADDTIKHPGDHPDYKVEVEPHVLLGWDDIYATGGLGLGGRFTIPIVHNGFIDSINNSVGIGFGMDVMHYDNCRYKGIGCSANYLHFPVVMQWNFFVHSHWSVFGEPGLFFYHGFLGDCTTGPNGQNGQCDSPSVNGVRPALWIGGRYHISETVSLTMRIGWPAFSFGVSFFP
jgi:hypothetical protein